MSVIAALVVLALEYASYRKEHTFSLFWVGIAITMLLIGRSSALPNLGRVVALLLKVAQLAPDVLGIPAVVAARGG